MSVQCLYKLGVITYFQLHREYIAEVLCINKEEPIAMCYGQCFLQKNLVIGDNHSKEQSTAPSGNERIDFPVFLIAENNYSFYPVANLEAINCPYVPGSSLEHSRPPFHPPALS